MSTKRLFSKVISESDAFLDMPLSAQALYFHLGMATDDDGFVGNPRRTQRLIGCNDDDLKVLIGKRFVLAFPSGVVVVKHHRINNKWDSYNCKRTTYMEEFSLLYIKENRAYTLDESQGVPVQSEFSLNAVSKIKENKIKEKKEEPALPAPSTPAPLHKTRKYLSAIPEEDMAQFLRRFAVSEKQIQSKAEDLENWCKSNGKNKKDYKRFLLTAMKKDFTERTEEELARPKTRVKTNPDGSPMVVNGAVQMETYY